MATRIPTKTDYRLQLDVLEELSWDTRVSATEIGVTVRNGIVTLAGTLDSWARRLAAQNAAHRVQGVLDVVNDIEVKIPGSAKPTDTDLAERVRVALRWDVLVPDERIRTTVQHGRVTLEGEVVTWTQKYDAERAIRNLGGIVSVSNLITVKAAPVLASDLRRQVRDALARHAQREADRIDVEIRDGTVTLTGEVDSWAERLAVLGAVRGTRGVRDVQEMLHVGE